MRKIKRNVFRRCFSVFICGGRISHTKYLARCFGKYKEMRTNREIIFDYFVGEKFSSEVTEFYCLGLICMKFSILQFSGSAVSGRNIEFNCTIKLLQCSFPFVILFPPPPFFFSKFILSQMFLF